MNEKKVSGQIYEFDPVIYPMRLWVGIKPKGLIYEKFRMLDNDGCETNALVEFDSSNVARTISVSKREDNWHGCLVYINRPSDMTTAKIAHESSHVTDWLCDFCGVDGFTFIGGEARAYFLEWVADCIEKVLKHKV